MALQSLRRLLGSLRRLAGGFWRTTRLDVLCHAGEASGAGSLPGYALLRLRGPDGMQQGALPEQAMADAGEPGGLASHRLERGDEFFAWCREGAVCAFGWVCRHGREVGPLAYVDQPGRVFLYNFHTLAPYRRHGLYAALLQATVSLLRAEGVRQVIAEVNERNTGSSRVLRSQGFALVARVRYLTLLGRIHAGVRISGQPAVQSGPLFRGRA